jgi:hypothetical protein
MAVKMGMCLEEEINSETNERVLLYDIWRLLYGDINEEV